MKQHKKPPPPGRADGGEYSLGDLFGLMLRLDQRLTSLEQVLTGGVGIPLGRMIQLREGRVVPEKEWYTTTELAEAMGVSQYTVQAHWCANRRIECEKDPDTGKWRIPGREFQRLVKGGSLRRPLTRKEKP